MQINTTLVEQALHRLGEIVEFHVDVEILLVCGAAAMLTNHLVGNRTTTDCDVMVYSPASSMSAVELAADRVASELDLGARWLKKRCADSDLAPAGWMGTQRVLVSHVGRLRVWAASRLDLLVMKVIAGRAQDIEDVRAMRVRFDELGFIRSHLAAMRKATPGDTDVAEAIELLEALEVHEHE